MMADTSPGKVQALRAMFSQNDPVVGLLPANQKLGLRPWKRNFVSSENVSQSVAIEEKSRISSLNFSANRTILKTLQASDLDTGHKNVDIVQETLPKLPPKPVIGPKPTYLKPQMLTPLLSQVSDVDLNAFGDKSTDLKSSEQNSKFYTNAHTKDKLTCDTIVKSSSSNTNSKTDDRLLEQRISNIFPNNDKNRTIDMCSKMNIGSDNYISKSNCKLRIRQLPPVDKIGPPPSKPPRPAHLKINTSLILGSLQGCKKGTFSDIYRFAFGDIKDIAKPSHACPPRPPNAIPHHLRSSSSSSSSCSSSSSSRISNEVFDDKNKDGPKSLLEEIEELYGDNILHTELIPEYTAEEEAREQEEFYIDAGQNIMCGQNFLCSTSLSQKPMHPPPPIPFTNLESTSSSFFPADELYQDASEINQEEYYEEMPCEDELDHYSNSRKEREKMRREEEKRIRRENKEKEKRERELEKFKKKFGISGDEISIDSGLVKADSRGGRNDLSVKKGEIVHILRIEANPPGKWLAKNKKGKCGYVELTNIEVDPDSVKSVMSIRRTITSTSEAYSEQDEGIYEMTY